MSTPLLLPPPPVNDAMFNVEQSDEGVSLQLTQPWRDYFNFQWNVIQSAFLTVNSVSLGGSALSPNQLEISCDEIANNLNFIRKYSDGTTVKSASLPLT